MNSPTCVKITNECISQQLKDLLSKELQQEDVALVFAMTPEGDINIGFPEEVEVERFEEVLKTLKADKVTPISFVTGVNSPLSGVGTAGGHGFGFRCRS